jgi:hypothetical protein
MFDADISAFLNATGLMPKWAPEHSCASQDGIAERWNGSSRREFLDHVIVLDEQTSARVWAAASRRRTRASSVDVAHLCL